MEVMMSSASSNLSTRNEEQKSQQEDEFWPLSGKPFFSVFITKSHIKPNYRLVIPSKIHPVLPSLFIPAILTYKGKKWTMMFNGTNKLIKRFDLSWRNFAEENKLKIGDACVFELTQNSSRNLVFRVQILRGDIPSELLPKIVGESLESPIVIE